MKYADLIKIKGVDSAKACTIPAAIELTKRILKVGEETLPKIESTKDVISHFSYLREKQREHLAALYLNARNEVIFKKHLFVGTLDANICHPREIFKYALEKNAASIILVHSHPSGDPEPSKTKVFSFKQKKLI